MLLNLELWFRTFIDGAGVQTLAAPAPGGVSARAPIAPDPMARPMARGPVA